MGNNISVFDKIKHLFTGTKLKNSSPAVVTEYIRTISEEHGFVLNRGDLGEYLLHFLLPEQQNNMLEDINSSGYLDPATGETLKSMIDNPDYDTYSKSIYSSDVESIFSDGVRLLGNSTSGYGSSPTTINNINLLNSVELDCSLARLVSQIKSNNGVSQGMNPINGTLILQIPKGLSKEEIVYYNNYSNTYNIKPEFIVGFLGVDKNHVVDNWIVTEKYNK